MANVIYNNFKSLCLTSSINFNSDTMKVALVSSSYAPSAAHSNFSDVTNEVSSANYSAGGATLASGTVTNPSGTAIYDAADVTWGTSTITARGAVLYKATGTAANSPLVAYFDFGSDQVSTAGNFTIQWNTAGIINLA